MYARFIFRVNLFKKPSATKNVRGGAPLRFLEKGDGYEKLKAA
jgi:hypothetical protein